MAKFVVTPANERQRAAWQSRVDLPDVERVRPGLWSIPVPIPINPLRYVLVYALELPDGVVIIDAGWNTDEAYIALADGLRIAGYELTDVKGCSSPISTRTTTDWPGGSGDLGRLDRVASRRREPAARPV